ncbi:hypothetical protein ACFY2Z_40655 [Streptomyces sp. NPDC001222]|uniref:nSTAND1 domain-containing NTPase n=1 Tax=Streptomyces sp. NPDC001222 TaxID=3364548 RepID=UPI003680E015
MAQRTGQGASTLSQAAAGERLPTLPVVLAYVNACGGDPGEWEGRWRQAAGEVAAEPRADDADAEPPYRGLARFEPADAGVFFGRDELTDRLFQQACSGRFTAVFGPSGSGKSSLLRAGLIPRLRAPEPAGPRPAALRVLAPGRHPMRTHAKPLVPADGDGDTWLIVDQFEELYTLCADTGERDRFIDRLLAATDPASRLRVVIAVRADFLGHCAAHPRLTAALQDSTVLAGPMSRDELREAIVKPAQTAGLIVERPLTARILDEVEDEPGALPLMSHALLETWRRRKGRALSLEAYEAVGGLHGAIARTAEDAYGRLTPAQADLARRILLRLITPGEGTPDTRRPAPRRELDFDHTADSAIVLDRLARARLITLDHDTVDLAHEALITAWPRLRAWVDGSRERMRIHRALSDSATAWQVLDRDPGALYRGARLDIAEEAFASADHRRELTTLEEKFLTSSLTARDRERRAAARTTRRLRSLVAGLTALLLIACITAAMALQQRATARQERTTAISRQIAAEADRLRGTQAPYQTHNASLAAQLDIVSYRLRHSPETYTRLVEEVTSPLFTEVPDRNTGGLAVSNISDTSIATYDSAHRILALAGEDDFVRLWDTARFTHPRRVGPALSGSQAALSPDGRTLAIGSDNKTVRLWDTSDPRHPAGRGLMSVPGNMNGNFLAFSSDGDVLAMGGDHISLWDVHNTARPRLLRRSLPGDLAVFSPRRSLLATNDTGDGTVWLWDTSRPSRPRKLRVLSGPDEAGEVLAFSPDARFMATVGQGQGEVRLWAIGNPTHPVAAEDPITTSDGTPPGPVAYSPDGRLLAVAGSSGIQLWNISDPHAPLSLGQPLGRRPSAGMAVEFSPDGRNLLVTDDQTLRVWHLPPTVLVACGSLSPAGFSPDGRTMATTCDGDASVQLWDTSDPDKPELATTVQGYVAAFAPRGHMLAVAAPQGVRLYDITDPSRARGIGQVPVAGGRAVWALDFGTEGRTLATYEGLGDVGVDPPEGTDPSTGEADGKVRTGTWDVTDPSRPRRIGRSVVLDVRSPSLTPSPDGRLLAAPMAGGFGTQLWDTSNLSHPVRRGRPLDVTAVAFAPRGHRMAVGTETGTVQLWDTTHPEHLRKIGSSHATGGAVYGAAFSPDGRSLAVSATDGTIQLWDVSDAAHLFATPHSFADPTSEVYVLMFSPDGRTLATSGSDGAVRLWPLDADRAIHRICAATGHILTRSEWRRYVGNQPYHAPCP